MHFEVRDTDVADPGMGYASGKLNRRNPETMIIEMRGAPDHLLNPSPRTRAHEGKMPVLRFRDSVRRSG